MELIYNPDLTYLDIAAADIIAHSTRSVLKTRHEAIWALPGGRSVGNIFERLSERDDVEWGRVHFFMAPILHEYRTFAAPHMKRGNSMVEHAA